MSTQFEYKGHKFSVRHNAARRTWFVSFGKLNRIFKHKEDAVEAVRDLIDAQEPK